MKSLILFLCFSFIDSQVFWRLVAASLNFLCLIHKSPKWLVISGYAREHYLNYKAAYQRFSSAVEIIKRTDDIRFLRWLQAAQFFQKRSLYLMGKEQALDPLFLCSATDSSDLPRRRDTQTKIAGFFKVEFVFSGLQIHGFLPGVATGSVDVYLDEVLIRNINTTGTGLFRKFSFRFTRSALKLFPSQSKLFIKTREGTPLASFSGITEVLLKIPHGIASGSPILSGEKKIDKKGTLVPTEAELAENRKRYLAVYADARSFFKEQLGKDLFLAYGTLLGCYRQGDFIPGDDDFDTGFMASSGNPLEVKKETIGMVVQLVKAGFTVSFNRRGRLFRLHGRSLDTMSTHLDVHSFWVENELVWAHNDYCAPGMRADYLPANEVLFNGVPVSIPAKPEVFLSSHYGAHWRIPDPGFINYYSKSKTAMLEHLSQALISPVEYQEVLELLQTAKQTTSGMGSFISIGSRDLYPLPEQEEDLE